MKMSKITIGNAFFLTPLISCLIVLSASTGFAFFDAMQASDFPYATDNENYVPALYYSRDEQSLAATR